MIDPMIGISLGFGAPIDPMITLTHEQFEFESDYTLLHCAARGRCMVPLGDVVASSRFVRKKE